MPLVKLVYWTSVYITIKRTPFFINKEFEANITLKKLIFKSFITEINILIEELQKVYNKLWQNIEFFNAWIKKYVNNLRVKELILKKKK